jgi:glycosyltransferase involved in cell wall biosynthesis
VKETKLLLITSTHLAKNPRLVKEMAALKSFYKLEVVFFQTLSEYVIYDDLIMADHPEVDFHRINWLNRYYSSRLSYTLLQKFLILIHRISTISILPEHQFFSGYLLLLKKLKKTDAAIIHGHNPGVLAVVHQIAKKKKILSGFDAEDFHRGEYPENHPRRPIMEMLEDKYIPKINLLFAASPLIGKAYTSLYPNIHIRTINNAFPKSEFRILEKSADKSVKLVWFSQIVGQDRGLKEIIEAIKLTRECKFELYIYGECTPAMRAYLSGILHKSRHQLFFKGLVSNKQLNLELGNYDIGIASEIGHTENRRVCLTNKIFAYTQAGLVILASNTPAQQEFLKIYSGMGIVYPIDDVDVITSFLEKWYHEPDLLRQYQQRATQYAAEEINWEKESEKLITAFEQTLHEPVSRKLRIALTVDPEIPVPPLHYGGIERIVNLLLLGLIKEGHEVTLFAHPDSKVPCRLIPWKGPKSRSSLSAIKNAVQLAKAHQQYDFDIVHSFGRLAYLIPILSCKVIKIMSYQREPTLSQIRKAKIISKKESLFFTGCSDYITNQVSLEYPAKTIYNAVDIDDYEFKPEIEKNAPLIFLGRIEKIKGTHLAIALAQRTGHSLIIAGNIPKKEVSYFEKQVKPHLNEHIRYVGPVNDEQKNELLGKSKALLMPILWDEPFGIVMIEAMACGTPVIGLRKGALPEIVKDGINGFVCNSVEDMEQAIHRIKDVDRQQVRYIVEDQYSAPYLTHQYLELYHLQLSKI